MRKNQSEAWDYFELIETYNDGSKKVECRCGIKCKEHIKINKCETSGMLNHLRRKHKMFLNVSLDEELQEDKESSQ